jgi:hypothetical protein
LEGRGEDTWVQNSIVTRGYRFMTMESADHLAEILSCGFADLSRDEGQRKLCLLLARQDVQGLEVVTENARIVATNYCWYGGLEYQVMTCDVVLSEFAVCIPK